MATAVTDQTEERRGPTVEMALYGGILIAALALRLAAVGRWPLLDEEASLAWAAWRFARGLPATLRGHSPLLFHANTVLFFLTSGSDALARMWSVVLGSLLVVVPYWLRGYLGRIGALIAALMLALSPTLVYFSWAVDGNIIVAFCAIMFIAVVFDALQNAKPRLAWTALPLLVLALLSGPAIYGLLAVLVACLVLAAVRSRMGRGEEFSSAVRAVWRSLTDSDALRQRGLRVAALLLLSCGLAFIYNPSGLQMALDQLGQWAGELHGLAGQPWHHTLLLLLFYEGLPFFVGLAGLVLERKRDDALTVLLRCWVLVSVPFSIVPGYRAPGSVLLVLLPLILVAARTLGGLWRELSEASRQPLFWLLLAASLAAGAICFIHVVTYLSTPVSQYLLRVAALTVFVVSVHAFAWTLIGPRIPVRAAAVAASLILVMLWVRAEVRLNYRSARDPLEPMVHAATSPDLLALAEHAAEFSRDLEGDSRVLAWYVDERLEVPLGWYLRGFEQVQFVRRIPAELNGAGVIAPADVEGPPDYVGLRFTLRSSLSSAPYPWTEWLRWWVGMKSSVTAQRVDEQVVVWVRGPLRQVAPEGIVE